MDPRPPKPAQAADLEAEKRADEAAAAGRAWWGRVPLLVTDPRSVFRALRADDDLDVDARAEPVLAITLLAGIAGILLTPAWGGLMDDGSVDWLVAIVATFVGGSLYGAAGYFLLGLAVWVGARGAGVDASFREARQVLALAALPVALSLVVTVPLIAIWAGGAWFHTGGADAGTPRAVVSAVGLVFALWSAGLLALGLRVTFRLPWRGVVTAVALAGVLVAALLVVPRTF